jgi:hypothetical protein
MDDLLKIIYENSYKVVGVLILIYILFFIIGSAIAILTSLI